MSRKNTHRNRRHRNKRTRRRRGGDEPRKCTGPGKCSSQPGANKSRGVCFSYGKDCMWEGKKAGKKADVFANVSDKTGLKKTSGPKKTTTHKTNPDCPTTCKGKGPPYAGVFKQLCETKCGQKAVTKAKKEVAKVEKTVKKKAEVTAKALVKTTETTAKKVADATVDAAGATCLAAWDCIKQKDTEGNKVLAECTPPKNKTKKKKLGPPPTRPAPPPPGKKGGRRRRTKRRR